MRKSNRLSIIMVGIITGLFIMGLITSIDINCQKEPENSLIHHTYVIGNTGKYDQLYADYIYSDYNNQSFKVDISTNGNNLYIRTLSHGTTTDQEKQFGKWLVNFYGAEEQ